MRKGHLHLGSAALYFALYLVGVLPYLALRWATDVVYDLLVELFPTVFHSYNVITTPDEYLIQSARLDTVTVALAIAVITYLALRLDNKRFERFIVANEGMYTMPEGLVQYCRRFLLADVITSLAVPVIFTLPLIFVNPVWVERIVWIPTALNHTLTVCHGALRGTLYASLISLGARLIAIPITVNRWRAAWLCGSVE